MSACAKQNRISDLKGFRIHGCLRSIFQNKNIKVYWVAGPVRGKLRKFNLCMASYCPQTVN